MNTEYNFNGEGFRPHSGKIGASPFYLRQFVWGTPTIPDVYWNQYSYEQKIKWLYMQYARILDYLNWFVNELNKILDAFDRRITALEDRMTALEARMTELERRMTELENRMTALEERMSQLEDRMTALEDRVTQLEERVTNLEGRLDAVENRLTEIETRLGEIEERLTEINNRITELEEELQTIYTKIEEVNTRIEELGGRIDELDSKIDQAVADSGQFIKEIKLGTTYIGSEVYARLQFRRINEEYFIETIPLYSDSSFIHSANDAFDEALSGIINTPYPYDFTEQTSIALASVDEEPTDHQLLDYYNTLLDEQANVLSMMRERDITFTLPERTGE